MNTVRMLLQDQVTADLDGINGLDPYTTNVKKVYPDLVPPSMAAGKLPSIVMLWGDDAQIRMASSRVIHLEVDLTLYLYMRATSSSDTYSKQIERYVGDARYCMCASTLYTHSGTAIRTFYRGQDPMAEEPDPIVGAVVRFGILIRSTWDAP